MPREAVLTESLSFQSSREFKNLLQETAQTHGLTMSDVVRRSVEAFAEGGGLKALKAKGKRIVISANSDPEDLEAAANILRMMRGEE